MSCRVPGDDVKRVSVRRADAVDYRLTPILAEAESAVIATTKAMTVMKRMMSDDNAGGQGFERCRR